MTKEQFLAGIEKTKDLAELREFLKRARQDGFRPAVEARKEIQAKREALKSASSA